MSECRHRWEMTNLEFGFVAFEKCSHCADIRTHFTSENTWDEYRDGECIWSRVENAQSFRFDLKCTECGHIESYRQLMGLLYCTGCLPDCEVELLRKKYQAEKTWILVAFGFLPRARTHPLSQAKLDILTEHFNQRRDTSRSRVRILPFSLIKDLSQCRGEFIHDIGMLSPEPPQDRKLLF